MSIDVSKTIAAKSDQLNADDMIGGPLTVRIRDVRAGSTVEQPITIDVDGWPQPYKPCKTMRRVLVAAWGGDSAAYIGRSMTLYRDPTVQWGGEAVGGIRISAMSDIPHRLEIPLAVTRKSKRKFVIEVLTDAVATWAETIDAADSLEALTAIGQQMRAAKLAAGDADRLRVVYQAKSAALKTGDSTDLNRVNEVYQGIDRRITDGITSAEADQISTDINTAENDDTLTQQEAAELYARLNKVMA